MTREELEIDFGKEMDIKAWTEATQMVKEGQPERAPTLSSERISLGGPVTIRPESPNIDFESADRLHLSSNHSMKTLLLKLSKQVQKLQKEKYVSYAKPKIKKI